MEFLVNTEVIEKFQSTKTCVLIPTYNNDKTLDEVIGKVLDFAADVIVVNDGSTDRTTEILEQRKNRCTVISYEENKGKGFALRTGFRKAIKMGFDHAVTIDADGQHFPEDLPAFADAIIKDPQTMIMGARNMEQSDVPGNSSKGNRFSNFWFYIETGIKLPDTQTGFRCYPLQRVKKIHFLTHQFEFEIESIVRLAWTGVKVHSIPVNVRYDFEDRVSHFQPLKDVFRITILNIILSLLNAIWFVHLRMFRKIFTRSFYNDILKEIRAQDDSDFKKAASIGYGIITGILPIWGFQIIWGLGSAWILRLNKFLVVAAAHISIPPMIPFILLASFQFGKLFVADPVSFSAEEVSIELAYNHFLQYIVGAVMLALSAGILSFFVFYLLILIRKKSARSKK